jgi:hypothetical protein
LQVAEVYIDGGKADICDKCRVRLCVCGRCSAYRGGKCQAQRPVVGTYSYNDPCCVFPGITATDRCRDTWEQQENWTMEEVEEWIV